MIGNVIQPNGESSGGGDISTYTSNVLTFENCSYVAGGFFKIGNVAFINIRVKCTDASANLMKIRNFPTYTNKTISGKNIVAVNSYNMTDETHPLDYVAVSQDGGFVASGTLIVDKEYAFQTVYLCD